MLALKKTTLALLAFGSTTLFAGTMGPGCIPGNITVPCEQQGWAIGGKALYLQPSFGGLNFPYYQTINNVNEYHNTSTPWDWGFMLEAAYRFAQGNDLNLNWSHLSDNNNNLFTGIAHSTAIIGLGAFQGSSVLNTKPTWDAANIEFGQHIDYTPAVSVRYHAGFEFARVDLNKIVNATGTLAGVALSETTTRSLTYNGFGPRVGADANYSFGNGLSAYANAAVGIYAGASKFSLFTNPFIVDYAGSSMMIVPELEAKVGGMYSYALPQGIIGFDAGWMWVNYFNPLNYADNGEVHSANFGLQGLYFGLKWVGNFA